MEDGARSGFEDDAHTLRSFISTPMASAADGYGLRPFGPRTLKNAVKSSIWSLPLTAHCSVLRGMAEHQKCLEKGLKW